MRMFTKTRPKNTHFWTDGKQFCATLIFWVEPKNFFKISYLAQFRKFLSEFYHVTSNYTFEQVINSNIGSNMAPLMVSRGASEGATESDMPWKVGLNRKISFQHSNLSNSSGSIVTK